jgi:hypothetical protein
VGGAAFVALAAVAIASRRTPGDRTRAAYQVGIDDRFVLLAFGVGAVLVVGVVAWAMWPDGRERPPRQARSWWRQYAFSLLVLLLLVLGGAARDRLAREARGGDAGSTVIDRADGYATPSTDTGPRAAGARSLVLAGIVVTLAAATVVARRRRADGAAPATSGEGPDGRPPGADDRLHLPEGLDEDDIASEPDQRRAVRLAYALLEVRLAGTATARDPSASPQEWLGRIRSIGDEALMTGAATLTSLYERARFASAAEPMTDAHRAAAVVALRQAQRSTSTSGPGSAR